MVANSRVPKSVALAKYYMAKRGVPPANFVQVNLDPGEELSQASYEKSIKTPVFARLQKLSGVDYLLLCKGVPIRITEGGYSVDGALAANGLQDQLEGPPGQQVKLVPNPYFNRKAAFSHRKVGFYLACRLDGYTYADAQSLVDRSLKAKATKGPFFFNQAGNRTDGSYGELNEALKLASESLTNHGFAAHLESIGFVAPEEKVAGYCSWGSNDNAFDPVAYKKVRFLPGAIAETFVSTSARTFAHVTNGQSVITDLIANGVTGVKGYVSEPYTFALARPEVLFDRYTSGFNLADSFYMASQVLHWKDVVVGDPLCRPYPPRR